MTTFGRKKKSFIEVFSLVQNYLDGTDWRVKEDANKMYSLHGLSNHIASAVQAKYWLDKIYPEEIAQAHRNCDIHIHDLGYIAAYCNGWDLRDLLMKGYTGVPGKVACAPARHFDSALNQLTNFLFTLRHEAAGAQAISSIDTYLAPFIRHDNLKFEQVKQQLQEFVFNMNVPLDKGFQAPFTNVTLDIKPSGVLANESAIIGGKIIKEKYRDFQKEINIFNRAFAEVMMEGDSSGRVFTWPIPTYNLTKDFPWDDPNLDPVWKMTAKFGIPYFSNFINSDMKPDDVRSMCCRLRIDNRELRKKGGGLFGANPLTGSIGIVTINMPRLGYLAKDMDDFFFRLEKIMNVVTKSLLIKREIIEELTCRGFYPYTRFYLTDIKKRFGQYWKNHFNTVGLLGMNEACLNFLKKDINNDEGKKFALEVLDFMRDRLLKYQKKTGQIFNLEATPGEGASYRFAEHDKKEFADIVVANDSEFANGASPFYTNSTQLPVDFSGDIFDALDHQDELQCKYTGGTVFHVYLGEKIPSIESTRALVKKIAENYKLPYFSITPTFSICPKHGYLAGEHEYCPKCDMEIGYSGNDNL